MPWNTRFGFKVIAPLTVVLLATGQNGSKAQDGPDPDVQSIRTALKQTWDSLQTIQFQVDAYVVDPQGRRTNPNCIRTNFAHAKGGRWASSANWMQGEVIGQFVADIRENGRKMWSTSAFRGHPEAVQSILVESQSDDDRVYSSLMTSLLWLWIPGGKPPIAHLDAGGTLEAKRVDGKVHASIRSTHKGGPILIELDADHDWLPSRVSAEDALIYEATSFRRDNGRWFYEQGSELRRHGPVTGPEAGEIVPGVPGEIREGFLVKSLSINRPLDSATFEAPKSDPGVIIMDQTTGQDVVVGGQAALKARQQKYGKPPATRPDAQPIEADVEPPGDAWSTPIMIAAAAALLTAGFLMVRNSRRPT